jgi:SAM-dependent methyltransferase
VTSWFGKHRSFKEQMSGLRPALDFCSGKSVLDIGCAEGLIALEFLKAGASEVFGTDLFEPYVIKAKANAAGHPRAMFELSDVRQQAELWEKDPTAVEPFDIVLALAVIHKTYLLEQTTRYCAAMAKEWLIIRLPSYGSNGCIRAKHYPFHEVDTLKVLPSLGFILERDELGPRGERVHYWRRDGYRG